MNMLRLIPCLIFLIALPILGCRTHVPATVTDRQPVALDRSAGIHVITRRHRSDVNDALTRAGLRIANDFHDIGYALEVKIGENRGGPDCRSVHNIRFRLTGRGRELIELKARGPVGNCHDNVFDDMSQELVANMI